MRYVFLQTLLFMTFLWPTYAFGQIPEEVLKPYKEYRAAIQNEDFSQALKSAKAAWKTSERVLGDHKTTGDLALNYALLYPKNISSAEHRERSQAFKRSIELASLSVSDQLKVTLDRHLEYLIYLNTTYVRERYKQEKPISQSDFLAMEKAIFETKSDETWHEAALLNLKTNYFLENKKYELAINTGRESLAIFEGLKLTDTSIYQNEVIFNLGKSLFELGEYLEAAKILQQNFEDYQKTEKHKYFKRSKSVWKQSWLELFKTNELESAYASGLCKCIDDDVLLNRPEPIKQIPPIYPASAVRSGEAIIIFDVKEDGTIENAKAVAQTQNIFGRAARNAAKEFIYTPAIEGADISKRKNIPVRVIYRLRNEEGEIIPSAPLKKLESVKIDIDMISDDDVLIVRGSRIRRPSL